MKTSTIFLIAVGAIAAIGVGYAIYFDQKRRNDPEFRKRLSTFLLYHKCHPLPCVSLIFLDRTGTIITRSERERKRLLKAKKSEEEAFRTKAAESISRALDEIANETFPVNNLAKEKFFMEEVAKGEQLFAKGEWICWPLEESTLSVSLK